MIADPHALLEQAFSPSFTRVEGYWRAIQLKPDFASGELLNVGVFFTDGNSHSCRLLENFEKFSHLYGEAAEDELRLVLSAVRSYATQVDKLRSIPCIELTAPKLARGSAVSEILGRIFEAVVSLDGPVH